MTAPMKDLTKDAMMAQMKDLRTETQMDLCWVVLGMSRDALSLLQHPTTMASKSVW